MTAKAAFGGLQTCNGDPGKASVWIGVQLDVLQLLPTTEVISM